MSQNEKSAGADERAAQEKGDGVGVAAVDDGGEGGSAIADGIRRDVRPWLNLVDDLSNLTRDAEISVPQVPTMLSVR